MNRLAILVFLLMVLGMATGKGLPKTLNVPFTYLMLLVFHIILEYETKKEFRDYVKKEISGAFDYVYGIAVLLWPVYAYLAQLGKS